MNIQKERFLYKIVSGIFSKQKNRENTDFELASPLNKLRDKGEISKPLYSEKKFSI